MMSWYTKPKGFKPCPFCGKDDLHVDNRRFFEESEAKRNGALISCECFDCGVILYDRTYHITDYDERMEILRKKWNKRGGEE